jgi:hypothetical protein
MSSTIFYKINFYNLIISYGEVVEILENIILICNFKLQP